MMSPRRTPESVPVESEPAVHIAATLGEAVLAEHAENPTEPHRVTLPGPRSSRRKPATSEQAAAPGSESVDDSDATDVFDDLDSDVAASDSMRLYLGDIGKTPLLSAEDEVDLAKRIEAGLFAGQIMAYRHGDDEKRTEIRESIYDGTLKRLKAEDEEAAKRAEASGSTRKLTPQQVLEAEDRAQARRVRRAKTETTDAMARLQRLAEGAVSDRELRKIVQQGEQAKDQLTRANLRLVVHWAKRFRTDNMELLDVIGEGNAGLIRGVQKFDYTKGYKFSTYGSWWIRQAITRAIADQDRTVRIPVHMSERIKKMEKIERKMEETLQRIPTKDELAFELNTTPKDVQEMKLHARSIASLDLPVGSDGDAALGDFVPDVRSTDGEAVESVQFAQLQQKLRDVLRTLDAREAAVIRMRFGLDDGRPRTLDEVGHVFKVSRERARQIENEAKTKLLESPMMNRLRDYLD